MRPLVGTKVAPNHLTWIRLLTGIGAASCVAVGGARWPDIGAGIFALSLFFDRADGDLARATGRSSPGGHLFDLRADAACNILFMVGLGIGLRGAEPFGSWAVALGAAAGVAVAAIFAMVLRLESLQGTRAGEIGGFAGFDPDDAVLAIPLLIWLDQEVALMWAAGVGAPLFALGFFGFYRYRLGRG